MITRALRRTETASVAVGHDIDLQLGIGRGHRCFRQTQLAADDVAALGDGAGFVERDLAIAALAAEPAVAGHDQALGRDVPQSLADFAGDVFGPVGLQHAMADGADGRSSS